MGYQFDGLWPDYLRSVIPTLWFGYGMLLRLNKVPLNKYSKYNEINCTHLHRDSFLQSPVHHTSPYTYVHRKIILSLHSHSSPYLNNSEWNIIHSKMQNSKSEILSQIILRPNMQVSFQVWFLAWVLIVVIAELASSLTHPLPKKYSSHAALSLVLYLCPGKISFRRAARWGSNEQSCLTIPQFLLVCMETEARDVAPCSLCALVAR